MSDSSCFLFLFSCCIRTNCWLHVPNAGDYHCPKPKCGNSWCLEAFPVLWKMVIAFRQNLVLPQPHLGFQLNHMSIRLIWWKKGDYNQHQRSMSHLSVKIRLTLNPISRVTMHSAAKKFYSGKIGQSWTKSLSVWRGYFQEIIGWYLEELLDGIRRMSLPTQVGGVTKVDR